MCLLSCDSAAPAVHTPGTPVVIDIQPFSDVTQNQVDAVFTELKKVYPYVQLRKAIPIPEKAYYQARKRYRADTIIRYLNREVNRNNHVVIALTNKDISCTKGAINDYGVMGLGFCPGKACVASGFRLSKTNTLNQLFKVAIHELGHTQGLSHCPVKTCFMRDAEGKNYTNELTEFCVDCKKQLVSKGWAL